MALNEINELTRMRITRSLLRVQDLCTCCSTRVGNLHLWPNQHSNVCDTARWTTGPMI